MADLGDRYIDDALVFYAQTHTFDTGAETDADSDPTYRVYEAETGTPLLTGTMAKLDDASTTGFYSEAITLSAANGFEEGKSYAIRKAATVDSVAGAAVDTFKVLATPPTAAGIADAVWDEDATGHQTGGTFGQAIGDPGANTETIYEAVVEDAAGTNIAADIIAIKAETASILTDTAEIGAAGAGLTNINLPDQTMNITGNITGNLSGTIGGLAAGALADMFDTDSGTTYGAAVAGSVVKEIADNATVAAASLTAIADAILKRDWTAVSGEADYSVLQALRAIRTNFTVSAAGLLTVYEEDGTTVAFTKQLDTVSPVRGITGATET